MRHPALKSLYAFWVVIWTSDCLTPLCHSVPSKNPLYFTPTPLLRQIFPVHLNARNQIIFFLTFLNSLFHGLLYYILTIISYPPGTHFHIIFILFSLKNKNPAGISSCQRKIHYYVSGRLFLPPHSLFKIKAHPNFHIRLYECLSYMHMLRMHRVGIQILCRIVFTVQHQISV